MTLAGYYNRQGQFDKTIEALEERAAKEPNNPEAFYTIATYYWDEAYRDFKLKESEKSDVRRQKGLEAVDKALQIKPDYVEALVYKGLLAPPPGEPRKGSGKAAGADQGSRAACATRRNDLRKQKAAGIRLDRTSSTSDWIEGRQASA